MARRRPLPEVAGSNWSGSGTITRDGDFFSGGTIVAHTESQLRDNDICPGEGVSGTTTMKSDRHVVAISYDGAVACDDAHSARWSLDGTDQGLVSGVTCSAGGPGGAALIVVMTFVPLVRRPRRR
jgi:hypothetical protein